MVEGALPSNILHCINQRTYLIHSRFDSGKFDKVLELLYIDNVTDTDASKTHNIVSIAIYSESKNDTVLSQPILLYFLELFPRFDKIGYDSRLMD